MSLIPFRIESHIFLHLCWSIGDLDRIFVPLMNDVPTLYHVNICKYQLNCWWVEVYSIFKWIKVIIICWPRSIAHNWNFQYGKLFSWKIVHKQNIRQMSIVASKPSVSSPWSNLIIFISNSSIRPQWFRQRSIEFRYVPVFEHLYIIIVQPYRMKHETKLGKRQRINSKSTYARTNDNREVLSTLLYCQ